MKKIFALLGTYLLGIASVIGAVLILPQAIIQLDEFRSRYFPSLLDRTVLIEGQKIEYSGGSGSDQQSAIIINGALTTNAGIAAERAWIDFFYPRFDKVGQTLVEAEDGVRKYDQITLSTSEGYKISIWFDITEFYGRPISDQLYSEYIEIQFLIMDELQKSDSTMSEFNLSMPTPITIRDIESAKARLKQLRLDNENIKPD